MPADSRDHALDLMVLTLAQHNEHLGQTVRLHLSHGQLGRTAFCPVPKRQTVRELLYRVIRQCARHQCPIPLVHMSARRGQCVIECTVIGQEQQALGVLIQPSDRCQTVALALRQ